MDRSRPQASSYKIQCSSSQTSTSQEVFLLSQGKSLVPQRTEKLKCSFISHTA